MYDTLMLATILERLGEVLRDLMNQPVKAFLVLAGIMAIAWWVAQR